jgi:2-polyprenyl-3-methyl-5-hydroxy-6-metoxy-1,4-benzoquinol methylase
MSTVDPSLAATGDARKTTNYEFRFAWQSPYGHLVRLAESLGIESGTVLDIGCGSAPLADPFTERGFTYIGLEIDNDSIAANRARGIDARYCDLTDQEHLPDLLVEQAAGKTVTAVLLTDVIEHVPNPAGLIHAIRSAVARLGFPTLLFSVPNVAHVDLASKLVAGRWDVRPTGLLDHTHVNFFTESRIGEMLAEAGFHEIARNDFEMYRSDQGFPSGLAVVEPATPLGGYLRGLRAQADEFGTVNQFVRAYALAPAATPRPTTFDVDRSPTTEPFLTVVMRTQGQRSTLLADALTTLAAQTDPDFEIRLMVHAAEGQQLDDVAALVASFDESFAGRVHVHRSVGGGRSRPLNDGLQLAAGQYVAFLDDDDVVFGSWVEAFRRGAEAAPGSAIRAMTADQEFENATGSDRFAPVSGFDTGRPADFDLLVHFHHNESPICSFALPVATLRAFRITFDERLPVVEDWDLFLRTVVLTGVTDVREVTSLYRRWTSSGSQQQHSQAVWTMARDMVLEKLNSAPILLPAGTVRRLADLDIRHREAIEPSAVRELEATLDHTRRDRDELHAQLADARLQLNAHQNSHWWKLTAPARRLLTALGRGRK